MKRNYSLPLWFLCLLAAVLALFTACGSGSAQDSLAGDSAPLSENTSSQKENGTDSYLDGTDYQYRYDGYPMAESTDSYFYLAGSFLYRIDKSTMKGEPFCTRPGCLHQLESPQTVLECEAFVYSHLQTPFLACQDGWLYLARSVHSRETGALATEIQRIRPEGGGAETVLALKSSCCNFLAHRGYLYYAMSAYDLDGIRGHGVYRQPLDGTGAPELVCVGLMEKGRIDRLSAYGNSLYLYESGLVEGYLQSQTAVCGLGDKKIRQLEEDDGQADPMAARARYTLYPAVRQPCRVGGKLREYDFTLCNTAKATPAQKAFIEGLGENWEVVSLQVGGEAQALIHGSGGQLFYPFWEGDVFTLRYLVKAPSGEGWEQWEALRVDNSDGEHYYHSVVTGEG